MDGDWLWGRNMGVERESRNGKVTGKISEMGIRGGGGDVGVYGKGGVTEGKVKREGEEWERRGMRRSWRTERGVG